MPSLDASPVARSLARPSVRAFASSFLLRPLFLLRLLRSPFVDYHDGDDDDDFAAEDVFGVQQANQRGFLSVRSSSVRQSLLLPSLSSSLARLLGLTDWLAFSLVR